MIIGKYDKIQIHNSNNKQYIPLNNNNITHFRISCKFTFSVLFVIMFFFFFTIYFEKDKNHIKTELSKESKETLKNEIKFLEKLKSVLGKEEIFQNEMMNKHTTFQLGGPAKFFIKPTSIIKILKVIKLCKEYSMEYLTPPPYSAHRLTLQSTLN